MMGALGFDVVLNSEPMMKKINEIERGIADVATSAERDGKRIDASFGNLKIGDTLKKQIYEGSQAVNGLTETIISQRKAVREATQDVNTLSEAYRRAGKDTDKGKALFVDLTAAKSVLKSEKDSLFALQTQQAQARLSVKKLRDEQCLYQKETEKVVDANEKMSLSFGKTLAAIGGTAVLKKFASDVVRVRGEFQQLEVSLKTLLQSKEKADVLMSQIVKTAAETPFNLTELATGAKQLVAYGFEAESINDTLIRLGNIASGLSLPLERLTYLYGTTMTQGRLYARDLMQFTTSGIPMLQGLADMYGVTTEKVNEMVTAGKIGFPEVKKVIENMTDEGGKFFNLMQEQSKTLTGKISNLGDSWDMMLNKIGESQEGILNGSLDGLKSLVENYEQIGRILLGLIEIYGTYKTATLLNTILELGSTKAVWAKITATKAAQIAQTAYNKVLAMNPYVAVGMVALSLVAAMWALRDSSTAAEKASKQFNETLEVQKRQFDELKSKASNLVSIVKDENSTQYDKIKAYKQLQALMPTVFSNMDIETLKLMDILTYNKLISEEINRRERIGAKTNLVLAKNKYENVKSEYDNVHIVTRKGKLGDLEEAAKKERHKALYDQMILAEEEMKLAQKQVEEIEKIQSKAAEQKKKDDEKKKGITYDKAYNSAKKEWEEAKKELAAIEKDKDKFSRAQYDAAVARKKKAKESYEDLGGVTNTSKQESAADKARKQLEAIREQQEKYALLMNKQAMEKKRQAEDLANQQVQSEIDIEADGFKKIQAQRKLNNKKEIQALERQKEDYIRTVLQEAKEKFDAEEELRAKQIKGYNRKTFDASTVSVDTSDLGNIINNTSKRQKSDQIRNQEDTWDEYLSKYGTFQQKKEAITRQYQKKINEADTAGEAATLYKELEAQISNLNVDKLKQDMNWEVIFGDMSKVTKKQLQEVKKQLVDFKKSPEFKNATPEQIKVIEEAVTNINNALVDKSGFFGGLGESLDEYKLKVEEAKKAQEEYDQALKSGNNALIEKATKTKNSANANLVNAETKVEKSRDKTIGNITAVANAMTQLGSAEFSLSSFGSAVGGLVDALSSSGSKIGGIIAAILSLLDEFGKDGGIEFGKNIVNNVVSAIGGTVEVPFKMLGIDMGLGGAEYTEYNEMVAKYDTLLDVWDELLDKKKAYIKESYGAEATKAGQEALDLLASERKIAKELANSRLDSGASAGSHSLEYRMWEGSYKYDDKNWKDVAGGISKALGGVKFDGMSDMLNMTGEQLEWIKTNYSGMWAHMDEEFRGHLDNIIKFGETEKEIIASVKEQITGISFDSFQDNFVNTLSDMDKSSKDFADNFEDYLRKSILQSLVATKYTKQIEGLYDDWAKAGDDNVFTEEEVNDLREKQKNITDAILADRESLANALGWTDSSSSSQDTSSKGFTAMSQDTGEELNGRFTALQVSNEDIRNSMLSMLTTMGAISTSTSNNGFILSDIRSLMSNSNSYLEDIAGYQKKIVNQLGNRLESIESGIKQFNSAKRY